MTKLKTMYNNADATWLIFKMLYFDGNKHLQVIEDISKG